MAFLSLHTSKLSIQPEKTDLLEKPVRNTKLLIKLSKVKDLAENTLGKGEFEQCDQESNFIRKSRTID